MTHEDYFQQYVTIREKEVRALNETMRNRMDREFHWAADFLVKSEQAHPLGDGENHSLEAKNDRNRADKTEHIRSKVANPS